MSSNRDVWLKHSAETGPIFREQAVLAALRQEADIRRSCQDDPRRDLIAIRKSPSVCRDGRGGGERLPSAGSDYQKTKQ